MSMPILQNHEHQKSPIGIVDMKNDRLYFKLVKAISKDQVFEIFGNAGIRFDKYEDRNGELFVTSGEILEFSFCPLSPPVAIDPLIEKSD